MASRASLILAAAIALAPASCAPTPLSPQSPIAIQDTTHPSVILSDGFISAQCYLPDPVRGFYRGPRFDWSGMVGPVIYGRHWFFAPFRVPQNPTGNDDGIGPAEEFGMGSALGYAEAKTGETFMKIGVGELIIPSDPSYRDYHFYKPFTIVRPGKWSIDYGTDWIEFHQTLRDSRGWGYDYVKRISLAKDAPVMTVRHRLTNLGSRIINTTWYSHNMINIDGQPIGPAFTVRFPVVPTFDPKLNPADARMEKNSLEFVRPLPPNCGISVDLTNVSNSVDNDRATVVNRQRGAAVEVSGDQPVAKYHFYTESSAACPEIFIRIHLAPGESKTWESRYQFTSGQSRE